MSFTDDDIPWMEVVRGSKPLAPPLICLHGGLGLDHSTLRPWLDPLADHTSAVVYYDHVGNGRSQEPPDWAAIDHATLAADVERVRTHLACTGLPARRALILGHSYGGFIALEFARRYPDRVAGVILCATAPALQHGDLLVSNARSRGTDDEFAELLVLLAGPVTDAVRLALGFQRLAPLYFHRPTAFLADAVFGGVQFRAGAFNRAFFELAPSYDLRGHLAVVRDAPFPVLLIGGDDDWLMPSAVGLDALAAELPGATRVEIASSGHFPFAEQPAAFLLAVRRWLDAATARVA